jgi:hypothetical protein
MKSLRFPLGLALLLLFSPTITRAQSSVEPITAKQRELVFQAQPDGSKILKHEQVGAFYRSSSGATMNIMGTVSMFIDEQGNAYEISHHSKEASFLERVTLPHLREMQFSKGYETMNGFNCAVRTTLVNGTSAGKEYWYPTYALTIRDEWTQGDSQTVRELYDIKVSEPDQSVLRIPDGYFIFDRWIPRIRVPVFPNLK